MRTGLATSLKRLGTFLLAVTLCAFLALPAQAITRNASVPAPDPAEQLKGEPAVTGETPYTGVLPFTLELRNGLFAANNPVNLIDPSGNETLASLVVNTAIRAAIGALTGAAIGGTVGGIDAALDADPNRTFWDGAQEGAAFGLAIGGFLPFATPVVLTGAGVLGVGAGAVGTVQSAAQGNGAQAAFRGVTTAIGAAGLRQIGLWNRANRQALLRLLELRARALALSTDAERGGQLNYLQGLGLLRTEQAFGVTVSTASEAGVDGVAAGLGKIQLKGPFLREGDLKFLSASDRQTSISRVLRKINLNVAYDTLVIDTLGLTQAEIAQLEAALANMNLRKAVFLLK
jgi:hypothetical protein